MSGPGGPGELAGGTSGPGERGESAGGSGAAASIAIAIDNACDAVLKARAGRREVSTLRVNPAVYDAIARSRARETARGNPILVLDLELLADPAVEVDSPQLG